MCCTKSIRSKVVIFVAMMIGIVMFVAMFGLWVCHKAEKRNISVRNFLHSSLPGHLTVDDFVMRCISNNVTSAAIFLTDDYGVCLCYDIDARFYCIQQTGQVMCFRDIAFAKMALRPKCEKILYNKDKSLPQSLDEISLWCIPQTKDWKDGAWITGEGELLMRQQMRLIPMRGRVSSRAVFSAVEDDPLPSGNQPVLVPEQ